MDERNFFTERTETKPTSYTCPKCRRAANYQVRWVRRTKKPALPGNADDLTRMKFAKSRDHLARVDDTLICQNADCRHRFDIPSFQSIVFL